MRTRASLAIGARRRNLDVEEASPHLAQEKASSTMSLRDQKTTLEHSRANMLLTLDGSGRTSRPAVPGVTFLPTLFWWVAYDFLAPRTAR